MKTPRRVGLQAARCQPVASQRLVARREDEPIARKRARARAAEGRSWLTNSSGERRVSRIRGTRGREAQSGTTGTPTLSVRVPGLDAGARPQPQCRSTGRGDPDHGRAPQLRPPRGRASRGEASIWMVVPRRISAIKVAELGQEGTRASEVDVRYSMSRPPTRLSGMFGLQDRRARRAPTAAGTGETRCGDPRRWIRGGTASAHPLTRRGVSARSTRHCSGHRRAR